MSKALLIDIGSTFTKVSLLDLETLEIEGRSQAFTTVDTDINNGLHRALAKIEGWERSKYRLACSSAAGGLKIIAIGLVPSLTAEAATRAALGAGGRVIKTYNYYLQQEQINEMKTLNPDLFILAGGTDGGNRDIILHNARKLAVSSINKPVIVAGNSDVSAEVKEILQNKVRDVYLTENVMPALEKLNIEPARRTIRRLFLERIVKARGLNRVHRFVDRVVMPTPAAVLQAAELLSRGVAGERGWGELMVIDVGGATIDVHSAASGHPESANVRVQGLEEPFLKRTVEGDLGIRYNALTLLEMIGSEMLKQEAEVCYGGKFKIGEIDKYIKKLRYNPGYIGDEREKKMDTILARKAVNIAISRHAGTLKKIRTPGGKIYLQKGKDLTRVKRVVYTGGIIAHSDYYSEILKGTGKKNSSPARILTPEKPKYFIDSKYLLAQLGLLAEVEGEIAIKFMKKYLQEVGDCNGD